MNIVEGRFSRKCANAVYGYKEIKVFSYTHTGRHMHKEATSTHQKTPLLRLRIRELKTLRK